MSALADADTRSTTVSTARARTGLTLLVATAAVAAFCVWVTHPNAVGAYGNEQGMRLEVGETVLVDAGIYSRHVEDDPRHGMPITVHSAVARISENTADADIELVLCRHSGDGTDIIGSIMAEDVSSYCLEELPIGGAHESFPSTAQLLFRITPRQPGTVQIEGIDLTYRDGIRRGTVHTGTKMITTTST